MQYQQDQDVYFIHVERDEPVMATLTQFCQQQNINNAQLSGIGAIKNTEIGVFDVEAKTYRRKKFHDVHELISFQGNVSLKDKAPFIHAHITMGDHHYHVYGGHLFETYIAVVGEFILRKINTNVTRQFNDNIGLATLHCAIET